MAKYRKIYNNINYVNLNQLPDPKTEYVLRFDDLRGGMNTFDLDFELKPNESPLIRNLSWRNGALCSRRGQAEIGALGYSGEVLCCYERLWHGWLFAHVGLRLVAYKLQVESDPELEAAVGTRHLIQGNLERVPGSFARYDQYLFYKTSGSYVRVAYNAETDDFTVRPLQDLPGLVYIPVIQINTDPETGAGDMYQPENRLSGFKRVQYNGKTDKSVYCLPTEADSIYQVKVDGVERTKGVSWSFENGKVVFNVNSAPPAGENNVEIMYYQRNEDAYNSVMRCTKMAVFGGTQELCIVLGGCEAQPNAYFWSGNTNLAMDPTYFPMSHYNLAGDAADEITGFGKQQNMLVIFQPRSVGRAVMGTEEINGRAQITMNYTRINSEIGCDLPRTIQLVENNLVWCSRRDGVCYLKDSSAAYENNIVRISRKVDGDSRNPGLLEMVKNAEADQVWSVDTGSKYLLGCGGDAYEWNYEISGYTEPSWFSHTGIQGVAFVPDLQRLWELTEDGTVAEFQHCYADFGAGIDKVYVLPPRNFGSYDRLKNIMSMLFTIRGDTNANTRIEYSCDYGSRIDPTPLVSRSYRLSPRDLSFRCLASNAFAYVARRKPGYHNIRHLRVKLYNDEAGKDLSLIAAQIFYTFRARQR